MALTEASAFKDGSINTADIADNSVTQAKINSAVIFTPVGTVITYAGSTAPTGYLKANGDTIPDGSGTVQGITADFSALYAVVGATLPDLRGEFIRGFDDGKGTDSGRSMLSSQSDQNKQHNHTASSSSAVSPSSHGHTSSKLDNNRVFGFKQSGANTDGETSPYGNPGSIPGFNISNLVNNTTLSVSTSTTVANDGGTETRPRNVALLMCIKF